MIARIRPVTLATRDNCYELLSSIEEHFDVSIRFWLDLRRPTYGQVECWVFATGSGRAFDYLTGNEGVGRALVLDAQQGNIYPALAACLNHLFHHLDKWTPIASRPPVTVEP